MPNPQVNARGDADTGGGTSGATDCCRIVLGSDFAVASGAGITVVTPWSNIVGPDPTGAWDSGAPDRLTPQAGFKRVWANLHWANLTSSVRYNVFLTVGGIIISQALENTVDATGHSMTEWGMDLSGVVEFTGTDFLRLNVVGTGSLNATLLASTSMGFSTLQGD